MPVETNRFEISSLVRMVRLSVQGICDDQDAKNEARLMANRLLTENGPFSYLWTPTLRDKLINLLDNQVLSQLMVLGRPSQNTIPFEHFERDPAPVSQIKKIVNALYHIECLAHGFDSHLSYLEFLSVNRSALHHAHEACRLLVHPDIDLTLVFGDEFEMLMSLIKQLALIAYDYTSPQAMQRYSETIHRGGQIIGGGVYQLNRHRQNLDYFYLLALTTCMPQYLTRLSDYMNQFIQHPDEHRTLDAARRADMLNWFDGLEVGGIKLSYSKIYRDLVRPMLELPTSLLNEVTHLQQVNQTLVQEKLIEFQRLTLPLIALAHKCEDSVALNKGFLSDRLTNQISLLYSTMIDYLRPIVNFDNELSTLLVLENDQFTQLLTATMYERWSECQRQLLLLKFVDEDCDAFFSQITAHAGSFNDEVKQQLAKHFVTLQPHVAVLDIKLSNQIVQWLVGPKPDNAGIYSRLTQYWSDSDSSLLLKIDLMKPRLLNRLAQLRATQIFQQALITDGVFHVYERVGIVNARERLNDELNEQDLPRLLEHMIRPNQADIQLLVQDKEAEARATYIIKKPIYSSAIQSLRNQLNLLCTQFNPTVQHRLQSRAGIVEGVFGYLNFESAQIPFPELEQRLFLISSKPNPNGLLSQPTQLLGMKRLLNGLYHLEEACIQVELLDDTQPLFLWRVNQLHRHLTQVHLLVNELYSDPWLSTIAADMIKAYTDMSHALGQVRDDYLPADEPDTLFRVMNALTLLPQQINQFETGLIISPEQAEQRHQISSRTAEDIKNIIEHSNTYVRLFLDSRVVLNLFYQLTGRLQVLLTSSHDVVLDNLAFINDELLTNIQIEADCWEETLCWQSGKLSEPVKQLLDTYYQGLLSSLQLPSQQHIELATNNRSLNRRQTALGTREAAVRQRLDNIAPKNQIIDDFFRVLDLYNMDERDVDAQQSLFDAFQKAIPLIKDAITHCPDASFEICNYDEERLNHIQARMSHCLLESDYDLILNDDDQSYMIQLMQMTQAWFKGLSASEQLTLDAMSYTRAYLDEQLQVQLERKQRFIQNYITTLIDKKLARYPRPLDRYHAMLVDFIDQVKPTIVTRMIVTRHSASEHNIPARLNQLFAREIKVFKRDYDHLEAIKSAIVGLKVYLDTQNLELMDDGVQMQTSTFESRRTLLAKYKILRDLEAAITGHDSSIPEQIRRAHDVIRGAEFKNTLLAYQHDDAFTLGWLSQCLYAFLELIRVYKPQRKIHCESMVQLATFSRHGFFDASTSSTSQVDDAADEDNVERPDGP